MAVVTVCSDFGAQEKKMSLFPLFPSICYEVMGQGLRGLKKNLCTTGSKNSQRLRQNCVRMSPVEVGMGQQWTASGAGILGAADLGMA